jgi:spore coat polysaccharide biosynthesis protein SpsF (cytidylyltransferase family)
MKTILVVVRGGVAYVVEETVPKGFAVEIIDFDNLQDVRDSKIARNYIERTDKEVAVGLASRS